MKSWMLLLIFGLLACAPRGADWDGAGSSGRGPLPAEGGKADDWGGRCHSDTVSWCGGRSDGACWCDELCTHYGDCCADKQEACDAPVVLRMADTLPAGQPMSYPVYFDTTDPALLKRPLALQVEPPELLRMASYTRPMDLHAERDGWLWADSPGQLLAPCDAPGADDCRGSVKLSLFTDDAEHRLLATKTAEITAPVDPLSTAACQGVGNVAHYDLLTSYTNAVGGASRTDAIGHWRVSMSRQANLGIQRLLIDARSKTFSGGTSIDIALPLDFEIDQPVAVGTNYGGQAWIGYQGACGQGELVVRELARGDEIDQYGSWIARLGVAWVLHCNGFSGGQPHPFELHGCVRYDAALPEVDP